MLSDNPYEVFNSVPMNCWEGVCGSKLFLVHTMPEFLAFYDVLMQRKRVACDTESSGFRWFAGDRIIGMSFGWGQDNFYLPVRHVDSITGGKQPNQLDMDVIRPYIQKFFDRKDVITLWSNGRFDKKFYYADGIHINCIWHDTLHLWKQVDENSPAALKTVASGWRDTMGFWHTGVVHPDASRNEKSISMWRGEEAKARKSIYRNELEKRYQECRSEIKFQSLKKSEVKALLKEQEFESHPYKDAKKDEVHYGYIPIIDMVKYAALDTYLTYKVYEHCLPKVSANPKTLEIYKNELKLSDALFDSEITGVAIDIPYVQELAVELEKELTEKNSALLDKLGKIKVLVKKATKTKPEVWADEFPNLASTDQLSQALINFGITLVEKTDEGKWKLDKPVLTKLARKHPICKEILEYRKLEKLKSTYVDNLLHSSVNGILYSNFNQAAAKSGRMSSSGGSGGINLQNIPGKDKMIRKAFLASYDPDYIPVFMDYSQIEVRLTAHFSQDPILIEAYNTKQDVHLNTSCAMFGYDYEEAKKIYKDESHPKYSEIDGIRKVGKILNFAAVYQVSPAGLTEQIPKPERYSHLTHDEWVKVCADFLDKYFNTHRHVKKFVIRSNRFVRQNGYFETTFGRIRHLPEYNITKKLKDDSLFWREQSAQRQGTNFGVQGEAADIFKFSVVKAAKFLKGKKSKMINYIHDDVWFLIHKSELHIIPELKRIMEDWSYSVPLVVDVSYTKTNWAAKKSIDVSNLDYINILLAA